MKKMWIVIAFIVMAGLIFVGCTDNIRARKFGGTMTITLDPGQKLLNATWKEADLWLLTRPMHVNEVAETYLFKEDSNFGIMQGKITIIERRGNL